MTQAQLRQEEQDIFKTVFMPGFLLLLGYLLLAAAVGPPFGLAWKAAYSGTFCVVLFLLLRRVLRRWSLTRDERTKFWEGFLAGSATFFVAAASIAGAPLIGGSPNPPVGLIWILVGFFVFGYSGGYVSSGRFWVAVHEAREWRAEYGKGPRP